MIDHLCGWRHAMRRHNDMWELAQDTRDIFQSKYCAILYRNTVTQPMRAVDILLLLPVVTVVHTAWNNINTTCSCNYNCTTMVSLVKFQWQPWIQFLSADHVPYVWKAHVQYNSYSNATDTCALSALRPIRSTGTASTYENHICQCPMPAWSRVCHDAHKA